MEPPRKFKYSRGRKLFGLKSKMLPVPLDAVLRAMLSSFNERPSPCLLHTHSSFFFCFPFYSFSFLLPSSFFFLLISSSSSFIPPLPSLPSFFFLFHLHLLPPFPSFFFYSLPSFPSLSSRYFFLHPSSFHWSTAVTIKMFIRTLSGATKLRAAFLAPSLNRHCVKVIAWLFNF